MIILCIPTLKYFENVRKIRDIYVEFDEYVVFEREKQTDTEKHFIKTNTNQPTNKNFRCPQVKNNFKNH